MCLYHFSLHRPLSKQNFCSISILPCGEKKGRRFWGWRGVIVVILHIHYNLSSSKKKDGKEWEGATRQSWFIVKRGTVYGPSEVGEAFRGRAQQGVVSMERKLGVIFWSKFRVFFVLQRLSRVWKVVWKVSRRRISSYPSRRGWSGLRPPVWPPIQQTTTSDQPQWFHVKSNLQRNHHTQTLAHRHLPF